MAACSRAPVGNYPPVIKFEDAYDVDGKRRVIFDNSLNKGLEPEWVADAYPRRIEFICHNNNLSVTPKDLVDKYFMVPVQMRNDTENQIMHERLVADAKQAIITGNKFCAMESLPWNQKGPI